MSDRSCCPAVHVEAWPLCRAGLHALSLSLMGSLPPPLRQRGAWRAGQHLPPPPPPLHQGVLDAQASILLALGSVKGRGKSGLTEEQRAQLDAAVTRLEVWEVYSGGPSTDGCDSLRCVVFMVLCALPGWEPTLFGLRPLGSYCSAARLAASWIPTLRLSTLSG